MKRFPKLALAAAIGSLMTGPGVQAVEPSYTLYKYLENNPRVADTPLPSSTTPYTLEQYLADGWAGETPDYHGGLPATWYVPLAATDTAVVETADMPALSMDEFIEGIFPAEKMAIPYLSVGAAAYLDRSLADGPATNWGHNADFGLILLDSASDVTITVSADPLIKDTSTKTHSGLRPGFSVWQGWDTVGGTRHTTWLPNGAPGLLPGAPAPFPSEFSMGFTSEKRPQTDLGQFMGTAWTYTTGGSATLRLTDVPAGKYTLVLGGVTDASIPGATGSLGATKQYKISFSSIPAGTTPSAARRDLNDNGKADLVWRNKTTGENELWLMNGAKRQDSTALESQAKSWSIAAVTDFDGDGKDDILWREGATGHNEIWLMKADGADKLDLPNQAAAFSVVRAADFQNDGQAEILWLNPTSGEVGLWALHKGVFGAPVTLPSAPAGKQLAQIADFDGNGTPDLWWRDGASGDNTLWLMSGTAYQSSVDAPNQGADWALVGSGDFDDDGKADAVWRSAQTGDNEIWLIGDGGTKKSAVNLPKLAKTWFLASVDDLNGDGQVDLLWRHKRNGKNRLWTMDGTAPKTKRPVPEIAKTWSTPN